MIVSTENVVCVIARGDGYAYSSEESFAALPDSEHVQQGTSLDINHP